MDKRSQMMKPIIRGPMQEVILPDFPDDDNTVTTTVTKSRRVSFGTNFVKEFIVGSAVSAQCLSEYEQAFSSSDSSNPNSSHSGVESGILNHNTFVLETSTKSNIMPPPDMEESRSVKRPKISSTICFSADSPTADMEFTEGCISLAKSILDKKNKEMTVIIQAKPKDSKEEKKLNKEDETKYFEGSQFDMSFEKSFCMKENRKEEVRFESEKTKVFNTFDNDMSFTNADGIFKKRQSTFLGDDEADESWDDEGKENKVPLNLIIRHLDRDNSDLESALFHPQVSLNDILKSNLHNNSNESEKLNSSESNIFKMPQMDSPDVGGRLSRLSNTDEMVEEVMKCNDVTPLKEPTLTEKEEDSFLETLHTSVGVGENKESFEEVDMDVTLAKEVISDITLSKIVPAPDDEDSFMKEPNLDDKTEPNVLYRSLNEDPTNNNMELDDENIVEVLNQLDDANEESRILASQSSENIPEDLCQKKKEDFQITATEEIFNLVTHEQKVNEVSINNISECKSTEELNDIKENEVLEVTKETLNKTQEIEESGSHSQECEPKKLVKEIEMGILCEITETNTTEVVGDVNSPEISNKEQFDNVKDTPQKLCTENMGENAGSQEVEVTHNQEQSINTNHIPNQLEEQINKAELNEEVKSFDISIEGVCLQKETENDSKIVPEVSQGSEIPKKNESMLDINETVTAEKSILMDIEDQMEVEEIQKDEKQESLGSVLCQEKLTKNNSEESEMVNIVEELVESEAKNSNTIKEVCENEEFVDEEEQNTDKNVEPSGMDLTEVADNNIVEGAMEVEKEDSLIHQTVEESDDLKKASIQLTEVEEKHESPPRYKEPSFVDRKVIENLEEQSKEPGCIWALEEVKYPQYKIKGVLSCSFKILESNMSFKFYLTSSEENTLVSCSFVCGGEAFLNEEHQPKVPDYWQVLNFGFEKLKDKLEGEVKTVKTIRQVPYFLDHMNLFAVKINACLGQIYSVLTLYPGSTLNGSKLSFRLFSFPILFSWIVSIDLQDLTRLSKSSITFDMDFGDLDKNKICEIFQECSKCDYAICEFIIRSTEYVVNLEKKTGFRSKRQHIGLLPKHLTG